MSQPIYCITVVFGSVESQERYVELDGWLQHQARIIEYERQVLGDEDALKKHISDWSDCGGRIKLPGELVEHKPWWRFWE